jgi:hypothetical protein
MVVKPFQTQIKGRPSVGVDLVYVFWTQQAQEPGVDPAEVSGLRGECDTLVQDHLARIGFPGPKALRSN